MIRPLIVVLAIIAGSGTLTGCSTVTESASQQGKSPTATMQAYTRLGLQYLQSGDLVNAKVAVQKALEIDADFAPAYNALGLIFQVEEEKGLAQKYYLKAIELEPDSAMFHNNYGAFLFAEERYTEACKQLAQATQDPFYSNRAQAFENLGLCYRKIDVDDAAIKAFRRSLNAGGARPESLIQLSDLYLMQGDMTLADTYYDQFVELVNQQRVEHTARSLWLGIQLARAKNKSSTAATYGLLLKNLYPKSDEYRLYKEAFQ